MATASLQAKKTPFDCDTAFVRFCAFPSGIRDQKPELNRKGGGEGGSSHRITN